MKLLRWIHRTATPSDHTAPGRPRHRATPARRRILYILRNYPQLSQTYIKTELRMLDDRYDIKVIATGTPDFPDPDAKAYEKISDFKRIVKAAKAFAPDVIHSHYLVHAHLIRRVAHAVGVPFTIRAHSFDSLLASDDAELKPHLAELAPILNDDLCLGVLVMPFARDLLVHRVGVDAAKVIPSPPVVDFELFYDRSENADGVMNTGACIPKKAMGDYIEVAARMRPTKFDLYAVGHDVDEIAELNAKHGNPVAIHLPIPHSAMPPEYKKHRWLLYTASFAMRTVGWPMAVLESQAAGVVVCVANLRPDLADYVGDAGFLYDRIEDVDAILSAPPPAHMRELGFDRARDLDVRRHIHLLTDFWEAAPLRASL